MEVTGRLESDVQGDVAEKAGKEAEGVPGPLTSGAREVGAVKAVREVKVARGILERLMLDVQGETVDKAG